MHIDSLHTLTGISHADLKTFGSDLGVSSPEWPAEAVASLAKALELEIEDAPKLPEPVTVINPPSNARFIKLRVGVEKKIAFARVTPRFQKKFRPGWVLDASLFVPEWGVEEFWRYVGPYPPPKPAPPAESLSMPIPEEGGSVAA